MLTKRIVSLASASSKAVQARPTVNASTRRQGSVLKSYAKTENPMSFRSVQMMFKKFMHTSKSVRDTMFDTLKKDLAPAPVNVPTSFEVNMYNLKSEKVGTLNLPSHLFGARVRPDILHKYVLWHLANKRQGTTRGKTRSEVKGSGKKMYKQKGTGRARTSTIRAPHKKGGNKAHPQKPKHWAFKLNKKVRKLALKSALSAKFSQGNLIVVDDFSLPEPKSKIITSALNASNVETCAIINNGENTNAVLAARNLPNVVLMRHKNVNVYQILKMKTLIMDVAAINALAERYKTI